MSIHAYIYKLSIIGDDAYYFGSTTTSIEKRFKSHLTATKYNNCMPYTYFRQKGEHNLKIDVIEELFCDTKNQVLIRENDYIMQHFQDKNCLNNNLAIITPEIKKDIYSFRSKLKMNKYLTLQNRSFSKQGLASPYNVVEKYPCWKIPDNPPIKLWKEKIDLNKITL